MSLVPTYVQAKDGLSYKNPTLKGTYNNRKWFICFDDTDPPEIVVQNINDDKAKMWDIMIEILDSLDIKYIPTKALSKSYRKFNDKFLYSMSMFFTLKSRIPIPKHHGGIGRKGECVYYEFDS